MGIGKLRLASALVCTALGLLGPGLVVAQVTITDDNSSFVFDPAVSAVGTIATPPMSWIVDGRRIATYVSGPANLFDVSHRHADAHVAANQLHAAGPLIGSTDIRGGIVYTLNGGAVGSGVSQLVETVELFLGPSITSDVSLTFTGFGFEPLPHGGFIPEMPDLSGLVVTGTTLLFVQGGPSFATPPFPSLTIFPFHSFTGFNTFRQMVTLSPGSTARMITELNVERAVPAIPEPATWALLVPGLALIWRIARQRT